MLILKDRYIFFLDIDNTLFNDGVICRKNREAVAEARKRGHLVFINTARSSCIIPDKVRKLKLDGYVTSLGCNIIIGNETIYNTFIPLEEMANIFEYFTKSGRKIHIEGEEAFVSNPLENFEGSLCFTTAAEILENCRDIRMAKAYLPHVLTAEEQEYFAGKYTFFQHRNYAEFAVAGHSKATGIKTVADYYGIDIKNTVAMGDSINDLDMLKAAGISVCMGDGDEELKKICDIVTCNAPDGGVAQAIYKVINEEGTK